jgi:ABC-2 type transport system ATP-binding protein
MMETLRKIGGGEVIIDGINVAEEPEKIKGIIGVQLQATSFLKKLTLGEHLKIFAEIYGQKIDLDKELKSVSLLEKKNSQIDTLSGGQKQRFSIVLATIGKPKVLFLDEPTTGLDPQSRRNLWDLITKIKKSGTTIILTTHYMDEAEILADRVAIMDGGKILAIETPKKFIQDLVKKGFKRKEKVEMATLEDVFIDMTGKEIRE